MSPATLLLIGLTALLMPSEPWCGDAFLFQPSFCLDHELRGPARPYLPQPGDIFLSTDDGFWGCLGHKLAHSGAPHHSGIIFALPDGRIALLEGGPENTLHIRILDLLPQLTRYAETNRVWIRQRCVPLTAEQSHRLTVFALAVADKPFAVVRMLRQVCPFKTKGPLREHVLGKPRSAGFDPDNPEPYLRHGYFCSELVTEACVAAGLLDPCGSRPSSMYPRNLFFGTSHVPYQRDHLDMSDWLAPSRFLPCLEIEPALKRRPWLEGDTDR